VNDVAAVVLDIELENDVGISPNVFRCRAGDHDRVRRVIRSGAVVSEQWNRKDQQANQESNAELILHAIPRRDSVKFRTNSRGQSNQPGTIHPTI